MKTLDLYIIKKFLGTFFYTISLIILIVIVFDISERIEDFIEGQAPLKGIVFEYYLNFVPYFISLFSPLFTFIAVIYFTSRMAAYTEFVAILSNGISLYRLLFPYLVSAIFIAGLSVYLNNYIIPHANRERIYFENTYLRNPYRFTERNIHLQLNKNTFAYMESYNNDINTGYRFSLENFADGKLKYKLVADYIKWDSTHNKWQIENYYVRQLTDMKENISFGNRLDTAMNFFPKDFGRKVETIETMSITELNNFIDDQQEKGSIDIPYYLIEKHKRFSFPFATVILTVIGLSIASRKTRGGTGLHLGIGLTLAFAYILFIQISTTFATNANLSPVLAVWIPNIIYTALSIGLLKIAPK